jgi:hypothetical protein
MGLGRRRHCRPNIWFAAHQANNQAIAVSPDLKAGEACPIRTLPEQVGACIRRGRIIRASKRDLLDGLQIPIKKPALIFGMKWRGLAHTQSPSLDPTDAQILRPDNDGRNTDGGTICGLDIAERC